MYALLAALVAFPMLCEGFRNRELRDRAAPLIGLPAADYNRGRMIYDLGRLRLHGLIERIPHGHHHCPTDTGLRIALCHHRSYARVF